jgi:site-specific recombinase XerD
VKNKKLDPWIEGYLEYLRTVRRMARLTIVNQRSTLGRVAAEMEKRRPGVALWKLGLEDYMRLVSTMREEGYSAGSINRDLSFLRGLLEYAWRSGHAERNVLDGFTVPNEAAVREPKSLSVEEARALVESCPCRTRTQRRDRLVILVLYGCGLRTQELCQLDVGDVDLERQEVVVRRGKGDRQRRVPVPDAVWMMVLAYLADRKGRRGALFRTESRGVRLTSQGVCDIVHAAAQGAGLGPEVTPKTLRHSYATHLMDRGVDLAVIASLMGHRSPEETGVYLHTLPGRKEAAVRCLSQQPGGAP